MPTRHFSIEYINIYNKFIWLLENSKDRICSKKDNFPPKKVAIDYTVVGIDLHTFYWMIQAAIRVMVLMPGSEGIDDRLLCLVEAAFSREFVRSGTLSNHSDSDPHVPASYANRQMSGY
jgi:hypothetical protein